MASSTKTIAFLGASTGVGLAALKATLAAGHQCIALCRTPSRLTSTLPLPANPNLQVLEGNAHDVASVSRCLTAKDGSLVDMIVTTIGGKPILTKMTIDDPNVCAKGMSTLLEALSQLRRGGLPGNPVIVVCSGMGMSSYGRDFPLSLYPLYHCMLKVPHDDKKIMEASLTGSGESFMIARPSLLVDGESDKKIRVGVEDPRTGPESQAIGYTISREDAGRWIAENMVLKEESQYLNKCATITY